MRSETAPLWVAFVLPLGIFLWVAVLAALVQGKVNVTRSFAYTKADAPGAYWSLVAGEAVIGTIAFLYGAAHFGPGG